MEALNCKYLLALFVSLFCMTGATASDALLLNSSEQELPELDCVIEPSEIVDLGSAVSGIVESIHAGRSDLIAKGAVLVELESSVERAALELAKVRAGQNAAIKWRQENAAFGNLTHQRNQELYRKSAISVHDMDRLKSEARIAALQVKQEQDNKRIASLEYRRTLAVLQQRTIRSPVDGVVMERFKSVGEYVEDEPVLRVAQLDPLHVEVIVPVDYMGRIVQGMRAEVTLKLAGSATHIAMVERVDRVADAASGTYGVRLSLANPDYKIPTGLRCNLGFLLPVQEENEALVGEPEKLRVSVVPQASESSASGHDPAKAGVRLAPEPTAEVCYSAGPMADENQAFQLSAKLQQHAVTTRLKTTTVEVDHGYLVLAAEQTGEQKAGQLLNRLKQTGIDHYVLTKGDKMGRVSLGAYNQLAFATAWRKKLAARGFATEIIPRTRESQQYWLDVALTPAAGASVKPGERLASLFPDTSFEPQACSLALVRR
ncbi:efflux RND transporter periplasmic adaptor subunit [Aliamphritea ceti]|uniref:efflux RND transporter periplasmic adaptor subunit n=1 Tax=Aliamphritea ceti TaxID=1524258 RepID=UPI0021C48435|nr:efflux RND transporter periplasmic adaptor subunit [Aliamphritea ceti]